MKGKKCFGCCIFCLIKRQICFNSGCSLLEIVEEEEITGDFKLDLKLQTFCLVLVLKSIEDATPLFFRYGRRYICLLFPVFTIGPDSGNLSSVTKLYKNRSEIVKLDPSIRTVGCSLVNMLYSVSQVSIWVSLLRPHVLFWCLVESLRTRSIDIVHRTSGPSAALLFGWSISAVEHHKLKNKA